MESDRDFKEFLALLEVNKVDYLIVGGYTVAFYLTFEGKLTTPTPP